MKSANIRRETGGCAAGRQSATLSTGGSGGTRRRPKSTSPGALPPGPVAPSMVFLAFVPEEHTLAVRHTLVEV